MFTLLIIFQLIIAAALIALILMQHGKGADMGAAFGSGSSGTVFGSRGSGSFLTRATVILAALFLLNGLLMSIPAINRFDKAPTSVTERIAPEVPAAVDETAPPDDAEDAKKILDLPDLPGEEKKQAE